MDTVPDRKTWILDPNKPGGDFGVRTIRNFIDMPVGSIIFVCRGLVLNRAKPVHIYAFAPEVVQCLANPLGVAIEV